MAAKAKEAPKDVVENDYTILKRMGEGTYGVVCAAQEKASGNKVAIKKVKGAVEDEIDAKRLLREVKLLRHLRGHENVIFLYDLVLHPPTKNFDDLYIITELMDTDLLQVLKGQQVLGDEHIQYFIYQVLRACKFFHSAGILHRDLKPNNLLANADCDVKVCDFGLARAVEEADGPSALTTYVVTRWYRPPELLVGCKVYTPAVDMWSCGCILAELINRKPLFKGKDYIDMLKQIVNVLGNPREEDISFCGDKAKRFLNSLPRKERQPLDALFPKANPLAIDLIEKLLTFDPEKRISAVDALAHPYLVDLHDPTDEPDAPSIFDTSFEDQNLNEAAIRDLIYKEVTDFQAQRAAEKARAKK